MWRLVFEHNRFVREHRDLYEGDLVSGSEVAFLFLRNERGRTIPSVFPSYLGLAQGFVEGNYPFDVVFAGDGRYVKDRLDAKQLEPYNTIIVPSPIAPTENQRRTVRRFARAGGVVVCQEPELLGLASEPVGSAGDPNSVWGPELSYGSGSVRVLAGDVTLTETRDVGTRFFREYTPELRSQVAQVAEDLGLTSLVADHRDGLLSAFPILQPNRERVVVHLVNYDVDYAEDAIRPQENVRLTVPAPSFLGRDLQGVLYSCDGEDAADVAVHRAEGMARCTIPEVGLGAVLVISDADE